MMSTDQSARILDDLAVYHFAWRASSRNKVSVKSYFSVENLDEVFGGESPKELRDNLERMKTQNFNEDNTRSLWFPQKEAANG